MFARLFDILKSAEAELVSFWPSIHPPSWSFEAEEHVFGAQFTSTHSEKKTKNLSKIIFNYIFDKLLKWI